MDDGIKTGECYFVITPIASTGKTFSDQTGRFPVTSSRGNKYVMIMYDYDSNIILGEAMKSRSAHEILRAFTKIHTELKGKGMSSKMHRLDNECPDSLKRYMKEENITYQLVPPIFTDGIPQRRPSPPARTISLPVCPASVQKCQCIYGAAFYLRYY